MGRRSGGRPRYPLTNEIRSRAGSCWTPARISPRSDSGHLRGRSPCRGCRHPPSGGPRPRTWREDRAERCGPVRREPRRRRSAWRGPERGVGLLILGRFTPQRKVVLDAVHDALRSRGYVPVMFDFDRPATRDYTETVVTLSSSAVPRLMPVRGLLEARLGPPGRRVRHRGEPGGRRGLRDRRAWRAVRGEACRQTRTLPRDGRGRPRVHQRYAARCRLPLSVCPISVPWRWDGPGPPPGRRIKRIHDRLSPREPIAPFHASPLDDPQVPTVVCGCQVSEYVERTSARTSSACSASSAKTASSSMVA